MIKLLAIECATDACTVALINNGKISQKSSLEPRSNARVLLPMVDELLTESSLKLDTLSALSITIGPGSFTGIRIGIAVAQGLAYGARLPILTWNTLEIMAAAHFLKYQQAEKTIIVALDARMGEIYWSSFGWDLDRQILIEHEAPKLSGLADFELMLRASWVQDTCIGLGSGFKEIDFLNGKIDKKVLPQAKTMLELYPGYKDLRPLLTDVSELRPLYLRNEITWKKRTRIRQ